MGGLKSELGGRGWELEGLGPMGKGLGGAGRNEGGRKVASHWRQKLAGTGKAGGTEVGSVTPADLAPPPPPSRRLLLRV